MKTQFVLAAVLLSSCLCAQAQDFGGPPPMMDAALDASNTEGGHSGKVIAVADEASNCLIVSAPDGLMSQVTKLIEKLDVDTVGSTEIRLFPLRYADPKEMADLLNNLFGQSSSTDTSSQQFFGDTIPSTSKTRTGTLVAVADARTAAVLVSASAALMNQAAKLVARLDADPAKKQKVFVYSLQNADVANLESTLKTLFQSSDQSSSTAATSLLSTRSDQLQQSSTTSSTSSSSSMGQAPSTQGAQQ